MIGIEQIYRGFINQSPQPKGKESKISARQRRDTLLSFVAKSAATTQQLSNHLNITENTVRNDIRVLIRDGELINESEYSRAYLVKAA